MKKSFVDWAMTKMESYPQWMFNVFWTDETHFTLHRHVNVQNIRTWAMFYMREYRTKSLHSAELATWCRFTSSFTVGSLYFEKQCLVLGWKTFILTAECYPTLLCDKVVPTLSQRIMLPVISFMSDDASPYNVNLVKWFLLSIFDKNRLISQCCKTI